MKPSPNPIERGIRGIVNPKFQHKDNKGNRVPGWEEVNFSKLGRALGMDSRYIAAGLTGRSEHFSFCRVFQCAELLGLTMAEIGARIDYTRRIDSKLKSEGRTRFEAHAMLEGRLTSGQKDKAAKLARQPAPEFCYPGIQHPIVIGVQHEGPPCGIDCEGFHGCNRGYSSPDACFEAGRVYPIRISATPKPALREISRGF